MCGAMPKAGQAVILRRQRNLPGRNDYGLLIVPARTRQPASRPTPNPNSRIFVCESHSLLLKAGILLRRNTFPSNTDAMSIDLIEGFSWLPAAVAGNRCCGERRVRASFRRRRRAYPHRRPRPHRLFDERGGVGAGPCAGQLPSTKCGAGHAASSRQMTSWRRRAEHPHRSHTGMLGGAGGSSWTRESSLA